MVFLRIVFWINKQPALGRVRRVFLIFSGLFIFSPALSAQKDEGAVWVKPPQMPFQKFRAYIQAMGYPHISYAQRQLSQTRERAKSFQLKDRLLSAQDLYLSGEGEKALEAFRAISRQAIRADWDEEDRRIILYSFLRQAQSERDAEKRKALLLSASAFFLLKISGLNYPDYHLFPPPLMKELEALQTQSNSFQVHWKTIFPDHEIILINGKLMQNDERKKLPEAFYRISAFSSSHRPWLKKISLSELLTQKIRAKRLTAGPCGNLRVVLKGADNVRALPFSDCPRPPALRFKQGGAIKTELLSKNSQLSAFQNLDSDPAVDSPLSHSRLQDKQNPLRQGVYQLHSSARLQDKLREFSPQKTWLSDIPPWVILGAGVVVFSLAVSLSQKSEQTPPGDYVY